jgi:nucleotide-binding universal stress UspA family protein
MHDVRSQNLREETLMANKQPPFVVLAAVAFDETGDHALQAAARSAELREISELHIVHVSSNAKPDASLSQASFGTIPDELYGRVRAIPNLRPLRVTAHLRTGAPARAILQTAADIDADLLVVGTHKRTGVQKLMLGSVAEQVLRDAHCPVLVAMPKDYVGASKADIVEPPCVDCVKVRQASASQVYWCERHARMQLRPHVWEPSDSRPAGPLAL